MHDLSVTLVAVATPPGRGGVGCIRLSGPDAHAIGSALFRPARESPTDGSGRARFGRFVARDGRALDHGYLVRFDAGASFTGDATAELWPHGSPAVLAELVEAAIERGAVPAGPGEFTYRALRNGRLDLARAEAVRDLVAARTIYQAKVAFAQAEGALSRQLAPLQVQLEQLVTRAEAAVECVDESETLLPFGVFQEELAAARASCRRLLDGFRAGRVVREGASLVVSGLPNAGKSSLFNRLLVRERAIVTDVPGTTRDTLEEMLDLDGIPVRLVDTAGLREVTDPVESEGVRRAEAARREADLVLLVLDGTRGEDPLESAALDRLKSDESESRRTVIVVNKCDLPEARARTLPRPDALRVSAKTGEMCDALRTRLREILIGSTDLFEDPVITDARHAAALRRTLEALDRSSVSAEAGWSEEWLLEDVREALRHLGTITGEFTTDDLYDRIFSTFCIGK